MYIRTFPIAAGSFADNIGRPEYAAIQVVVG